MKNTGKNTVEEMLKRYPETQDSDNSLTAIIWFKELLTLGFNREDAIRFCQVLKAGKLSHPHSIRNHRQQIQRDEPSLRGQTYTKRQRNSVKFKKEYFE